MMVKKKSTPIKYALYTSTISFFVISIILIQSISLSSSSTAAVSYIFVPFISFIGSLIFFIYGYSIGRIAEVQNSKLKNTFRKEWFSYLVVFSLSIYIIFYLSNGAYLSYKVKQARETSQEQAHEYIINGQNKFVLGALLENKKLPSNILNKIAQLKNPELHESMSSIFSLLGKNTKGLSVMRLLARHPNISPDSLDILSNSPNDSVLGSVVRNSKTKVKTLFKIHNKKLNSYYIFSGFSYNKKTPLEILKYTAKNAKSKYTLEDIYEHPNSSDELKIYLKNKLNSFNKFY